MTEQNEESAAATIFQIIGSVPAVAAATAGASRAQTRANAARAPYARKVFDEHQWRTVRVLCDLILPADERSGSATQAGVPEFIDDWLDFRKQQDGNDDLAAADLGRAGVARPRIDAAFPEELCRRGVRSSRSKFWIALPGRNGPRRRIDAGLAFFSKFRDLTVSGFLFEQGGDCRSAVPRERGGRGVEGLRSGGVGDDRRADEERL